MRFEDIIIRQNDIIISLLASILSASDNFTGFTDDSIQRQSDIHQIADNWNKSND